MDSRQPQLMIVVASIVFGLLATTIPAQKATESIPVVQVKIGNGKTVPNGIVRPPQPLSCTYPAYTDEARELGIEGTVTVEVVIDI